MHSFSPRLKIRAHTLLCLQGFRGEGYTPGFVANLSEIHRTLAADPAILVKVVDEPDVVCSVCPHLAFSGCTLRDAGSEVQMQAQDKNVLDRLGFDKGIVLSWKEILDRIRNRITGSDLPLICGQCRWLPLGYCREGLEQLYIRTLPVHEPQLILPQAAATPRD